MTYLLDYENIKKNLKFKYTETSSQQDPGTSWVNVDGSQISYTPASGASKVIYEFTSVFGYKEVRNSVEFKLQIGDSIGTVANIGGGTDFPGNDNYSNGIGTANTTSNYAFCDTFTIKFMLDVSDLSWSGEKVLVVKCRAYDGQSIHEPYINSTTDGSSTFLFNPFVSCYSI